MNYITNLNTRCRGKLFVPKEDKMSAQLTILHNEEPRFIQVTRRLCWIGHVTRKETTRNTHRISIGKAFRKWR
jgi:hypothetical protein